MTVRTIVKVAIVGSIAIAGLFVSTSDVQACHWHRGYGYGGYGWGGGWGWGWGGGWGPGYYGYYGGYGPSYGSYASNYPSYDYGTAYSPGVAYSNYSYDSGSANVGGCTPNTASTGPSGSVMAGYPPSGMAPQIGSSAYGRPFDGSGFGNPNGVAPPPPESNVNQPNGSAPQDNANNPPNSNAPNGNAPIGNTPNANPPAATAPNGSVPSTGGTPDNPTGGSAPTPAPAAGQ